MIWLTVALWACKTTAFDPVDMMPLIYCGPPQPVTTRPIIGPAYEVELIPPPLGRNRFRPKRLPTE